MKAAAFHYHRPESLPEAIELLQQCGEDGKVLAGGQSLLPMLNLRLARPDTLIDIGRVAGLDGVEDLGSGAISLGALVTHHRVELGRDAPLRRYPMLSHVAALIGHLPIRTRGTVGGSLAHADGASEWCLLSTALDAVVSAESPSGRRAIPIDSFFRGVFTTALTEDEVLTDVVLRRLTGYTRLEEYARRRGDFAIVAVAANLEIEGRRCRSARIALGGVAGTAVRGVAGEQVLAGLDLSERQQADAGIEEAAQACARGVEPPADQHASAAYRRRLVLALTRRALRGCLDDWHTREGASHVGRQ